MSKGLKSYLYNDTYSVDNAGNAYVVANKSEGDVILEIPLLKGFVNDYIDIFGYFSYSQRARANGLLGKGSGISLIRRIKSYPNTDNYFVIEDEFGNDIKYEIPRDQIDSNTDIYRNFERKEYVITDYDGTYLYNNNGSYIFYPYGEFKPRGISLNYNNYISISYNDDYSTNELDYTISTSGNIINMTYTTNPSNGSCQATITLDSNNFINNVSIMAYNDDLVIKEICNNTYNIIEGSYIEVIDNITNKRLKINLSGNNATSVYEAYNSNYTDKVVNTYYYNPSYNYCYITHPFESFNVYYNENNRLEYIKSNDKIQYYKFIEGEFNWLKSLSNVIVPNYQNSIKNQNLVNNGFFVSDCNGWTTNNCNVSRFIDNQAPNGKFMYIQHNNVNNDAYITQTINKSGKNGDLFTFGCWYMCDFCQEEVKSGKVKIEFINNNSVVQTIYKDLWSTLEDRGLWLYILELIKVNYDYTNIRISFYSYNPNSCLSISGVELYGFLNGTIYEYDNYGNIIEIHNPRNNVKYKISMNDKRKYLIDQIIRDESDIISIEYDNKGNVKNKKHIGNFIEEYQYDNVSNLTKYTKSNGLYNMEISNKYIGRKLTESVNELGLKTTYDIDNRLGNIKSVTDAAGNKIKYLYTDNVLFGGFEYYNNKNILLDKTIVSRNTNKITNKVNNLGSEYEYDIDSKNRVLRVKSSILNSSNNKNIEEYTYLTKNNTTYDLLSQLKTINGDSYLYSYDNYGNITKIELKKNNSDVLLKLCEYVYDELDRVIQIKEYKINDDALGTTLNNTINYEFNKYGDLSKVTDTLNNKEEYIYDDYGSILYINETVNNQTVTKQINNQLSNPNDFYNYMKYQDVDICYSSFFNEKVTIDGEERYSAHLSYISGHEFSKGDYLYINPNNDASSNINSEGLFNSCRLNKDFSLKYNLGVLNPINDIKFNVSFWFKAEEKDKYVRLLRLEKNNDTQNSFEIMINNNNQVELHNGAYSYDNHFLRSKTIKENQWNFISITYWYEDYETTSYVTHYSLMVNDEILNYQVLNKAKIAGNTNLTIGYSDLSQLNFVGKITSLIVYKEAVTMNEKFIRDLYYTSKEYIIDSYEVVNEQAINQRVIKNMYVNETSYKPTNVLPLNNSFYTTSGKEPYINGMTSYQSLSKAKEFSYNQDIERFTYRANGKELVYDFNFKYDHSIYLQTYFNESSSNQYIFQNIDSNNKTMGLFRNINKKLILEVNGVNYDTGYVISNETWNKLMFSYKSAIVASSSLSITVEHDFRIIVDGVVKYETTISNDFEYDWMKTYIGRAYDPLYPKPMYGQIEMVQTYNTYYTNSVAINICNSKKIISSVTKLNQFGLVCKENTANNIVCNYYQYLITDNTIKPLVNIQNINDNLNVIYNYDNYNENVLTKGLLTQYGVLKNLTIRTNTIYQYNDKNELISENDIANNKNIIYNYDNHGNIISKNVNGTITNFTYSTTYPDQLISVGNKNIKYSSDNQRYPIEYGTYNGNTLISGYRYQWDGNKLIAVNKINYPYTSFKYDSNGKRIRKIHEQNSEFIYKDYTYLGNKLTKEVINDDIRGDINTLYYLYDANNNLYGLKYNSTEYYYLRDNLNNVIGIIDSNKNIVCEYLYDAYGNHKVLNSNGVENTSYYFIGNLNPFRYRGYYYDVETSLFWLSSRYYSPELCRFISPDDVEYLDPESVNGLNLYCYCYNDPINYCDPSGNMAIATIILLACIGVGAAIGGTYAGVTAYNDGARGWELVGWTALGAVAGGAVGGIVGYYAGPLAASLLTSGGGLSLAGAGAAGLTMSGVMAANIVVGGSLVVSAAGALAASGLLMFAKTSRQSGKATSSDKPSWFNGSMVDPSKTPQQNATDILNWKYGPGNWSKGPGTEYNKIVKWIERFWKYYRG